MLNQFSVQRLVNYYDEHELRTCRVTIPIIDVISLIFVIIFNIKHACLDAAPKLLLYSCMLKDGIVPHFK